MRAGGSAWSNRPRPQLRGFAARGGRCRSGWRHCPRARTRGPDPDQGGGRSREGPRGAGTAAPGLARLDADGPVVSGSTASCASDTNRPVCSNQPQLQGLSKRAAIEKAAGIRLRPILMTTAATVLGVVPSGVPGAGDGSSGATTGRGTRGILGRLLRVLRVLRAPSSRPKKGNPARGGVSRSLPMTRSSGVG
ncbi:MAG: hypothetical protein DYH20_06605 [Gammaproteobacteria bacterium PRO9]|nr:hypothetical protein [Gammaproteobacteria bacterium PRO9]